MPQPASVETCSPSAASPARRHSLVCLHPSKLYCSVKVTNPVISSCGSDQPSKQKLSVGSSLLGGSKEKGSFGAGALTLLRYSWHGESMAKQQRFGKSATMKVKSGSEPRNSTRERSKSPQPSLPPNPFDGVSPRLIRQWSKSFDAVLESSVGRRMFHDYLKSECSQENIQFWEACERFKLLFADDLPAEAKVIYNEFVRRNAEKQVNLNHESFELVESKIQTPGPGLFDEAQYFIYQLMARDSYPRFIRTKNFQEALQRAERSSQ